MLNARPGELLGVMLLLGILFGIPLAVFLARDTAATWNASDGDAVIVLSGRNVGTLGQSGSWIVEYANIPIHKDEGVPIFHVRRGQRVLFRVTAQDVTHGFAISGYGIDAMVHAGAYENISFVADKAGEFTIECSVFCGLGHHGMVAKLVVEA